MQVRTPQTPTRRETPLPWGALALALAATMTLTACGSDGGGNRRPPPRGAPPPPPPEKDLVLENWELLGENPRWVPIHDMFTRYEKAKIEELANPLQPNLVTFVPKPIIDRKPKVIDDGRGQAIVTDADSEKTEIDKTDPRRQWTLDRFQLIILMTGTANPIAVVVDPKDNRFELRRGDPIGNEGGRVRAITQYAMLVAIPGKTKPHVISLRPPLAKLGTAVEQDAAKKKKAEF